MSFWQFARVITRHVPRLMPGYASRARARVRVRCVRASLPEVRPRPMCGWILAETPPHSSQREKMLRNLYRQRTRISIAAYLIFTYSDHKAYREMPFHCLHAQFYLFAKNSIDQVVNAFQPCK